MISDKAVLRRRTLLRRAAMSPDRRAVSGIALASALREWPGGRVAAYASVGDEPDTAPLLAGRHDVLLPVLLADGELDWAVYDGELV
ncbi:MAG: 5-formyltetrahydrofolate cyclo-ligase, partial [Frankiales bacterium]|nr:5-formyltetrahydrofolate cyclo-ligase [Frankiales bacterium]